MKKCLLALVFSGLAFVGCSNVKEEPDLFKKIDKEKYFKRETYRKYFIKEYEDRFHDIMYSYYDLNKNGKPDLIVLTTILGRKGSEPILEPYAFAVRTDENEDDEWDRYYFDRNGDWIFDEIDSNPEKEETSEDREEFFV